MSIKRKTFGLSLGFIFINLIWFYFVGAQDAVTNGKKEIRRITLVAKGMVFRIEDPVERGGPAHLAAVREENPSLVISAGEKVQLVIRNEDPGIVHNLAIEGLELRLSQPLHYGDSEVLTFTAPWEGRIGYFCTEHPEMMRGEIIIRDEALVQRSRN